MPVLLDTDHLSVLQWREQPACNRLLERLDAVPPDDIATSIVNFHEQVQGWLAFLNRAKKPAKVVLAYAKLEAIWRSFLKMNVLSFTDAAQTRFVQLRSECPRVGTVDLRIASVAITTDATLLTRNQRDFQKVPGIRTEDWTI